MLASSGAHDGGDRRRAGLGGEAGGGARSERALEVVSDALRAYLSGLDTARGRPRMRFPQYGGAGLHPGVDLADKAALAELLDAGDDRAAG